VKRNLQGSAILLALLLIAVVGVLTAAALSLHIARTRMVEQAFTAVERRLALENAKALAQEFFLERVMTSTTGADFDLDLGSLGGISVPGWGAAAMQSVQKVAGVNHFNPGNGDTYTLALTVTLNDGESDHERRYEVRSRSPLLAGTLLASHTPTIVPGASLAIGGIDVDGGAFVWVPGLGMTFTPDAYSVPDDSTAVTFSNSAGTALAALDLALPRQIANPRAGAALFYSGQLDVIDNAAAAANSLAAKVTSGPYTLVNGSVADADATDGITCDGAGVVTINLGELELGNVYIPGEISTLVLDGQPLSGDTAADAMTAILVVVNQPATSSRDLTQVTLNNHNSRRVVLAVKKESSVGTLPIQFTTAQAAWRLLLELENTPVAISTTTAATLTGGIRSDRSLLLSAGTLRLALEADPKYLDQLASRTAWVESYSEDLFTP
jgi:hypothetical protein